MEQELDIRDRFWRPRRTAIAMVFICVILGLTAYLLFIVDSVSGGYGPHVVFPALRDRDSLRMTLTRTSCFGPCPDYSVEIRGDGTVIYEGNRCVGERGHHDGRILESRVDELFEKFMRADFLSLRSGYRAIVTDVPTYVISLRYDGVSKIVTDYDGASAGMPDAVTDLENAIDDIAESNVWVGGGGGRC